MSDKITKVGFSITGEFMTEHSRNLWAEGSFAKAFRILECLIGSTREQHEAILFGRKKLVGTNSLDFVDDDWTPPGNYCPSIAEALRRGENWPELERLREQDAIDRAERKRESEEEDDRDDYTALKLTRKLTAQEIEHHHLKIRLEMAGFDSTALAAPEAVLNRGYDITPTLDPKMESVNGWLLPDGKYYRCGPMEHVGLAAQLLPEAHDSEKEAETRGWVKLVKSFTGFHCLCQKRLTKRQRDKLFDYAQKHGRDYEEMTAHLIA